MPSGISPNHTTCGRKGAGNWQQWHLSSGVTSPVQSRTRHFANNVLSAVPHAYESHWYCLRVHADCRYSASPAKAIAESILQFRQRKMCSVRLNFWLLQLSTTGVIKRLHQFRIAIKTFRRCHIFNPMFFPQAICGAKGTNT